MLPSTYDSTTLASLISIRFLLPNCPSKIYKKKLSFPALPSALFGPQILKFCSNSKAILGG